MTYKFRFSFVKTGIIKYISHLDLMRTFTRAFRRAGLPLKITQGFNPHPKFSIARALKLGVESESEEAQVELVKFIRTADFQLALNQQLPQEIQVKNVSFGDSGFLLHKNPLSP